MNRKMAVILVIILAGVIIGGIIAAVQLSPEFQVKGQLQVAYKLLEEGKYEEAILTFNKIIAIKPKSIEARIGLGKVYIAVGRLDEAVKVLTEALAINPDKTEVYLALANVHIIRNSYEKAVLILRQGYERLKDSRLKQILEEIVPKPPKASLEGGKYTELKVIELISNGNEEIYYTLDNSPVTKQSSRYSSSTHLKKGKTTLRFAAMGEKGVLSEEVAYEYHLAIKPKPPGVSLEGGKYIGKQMIKLVHDPEDKVFYTTDGSAPTKDSMKYGDAIILTPGKKTLRIIAVGSDDLISEESKYEYDIEEARYFEKDERNILGLKIDMPMEEAIKVIGNPKKEEYVTGLTLGYVLTYDFGSVRFYSSGPSKIGAKIMTIKLTSNIKPGPRNIRVGDDLESVLAKFPNEEKPMKYDELVGANSKILYDKAVEKNTPYDGNYEAKGPRCKIIYENKQVKRIRFTTFTCWWGDEFMEIEFENEKVKSIEMGNSEWT